MSEAELKTEPEGGTSVTPIVENLEAVRKRVREVAVEGKPAPTLVAVSKTKPLEDLQAAYEAGQRIFGENYVGRHALFCCAGLIKGPFCSVICVAVERMRRISAT